MSKNKNIPIFEIIAIANTIKDSSVFNESKDKLAKFINKIKEADMEGANTEQHTKKEPSDVFSDFEEDTTTFKEYNLYLSKNDNKTYTLTISILGHDKESIDLRLSEDEKQLLVRSLKQPNSAEHYNHERYYAGLDIKDIDIKIPLGRPIDRQSIKAKIKNGLLDISFVYKDGYSGKADNSINID